MPSTRVGTIVRKRNTRTAATTPALLPPKPISAAVRLSSTIADPARRDRDAPEDARQCPGSERLDDAYLRRRNLERPQRDQQNDEDRQAAGKRGECEQVPAALEDLDDTDPETLEAASIPRDRLTVKATLDPGRCPCRQVTDLSGHAVAVEDEHERSDHDAQDCDADERHRREHCRLLPGHRQQEDRQNRIREVGELVPEAHQGHRPSDGVRCKACAPQHPEGGRDPDGRSSRHDERERGRRLGHHQRGPEAQAGQEGQPRRRESENVDRGDSHERRCPPPRYVLHHPPHVAVVRDRR